MGEITLARATERDVAGIQAVAMESWRAAYQEIFTPEFINDFVARAYERQTLLCSIANPADIFLVARDGARVVGFCHFGAGGLQLYRIHLLPEYQHRGIGTRLIAELELRLAGRDIASYHCYVHCRNEQAQGFYQRRGFVHQSERDQPECEQPDNREWYMEKRLRSPVDLLDGR